MTIKRTKPQKQSPQVKKYRDGMSERQQRDRTPLGMKVLREAHMEALENWRWTRDFFGPAHPATVQAMNEYFLAKEKDESVSKAGYTT